jgi:hypothetical protein
VRWPWRSRDGAAPAPPQTAAVADSTPSTARAMRRTRQHWQPRMAWFARNLGALRFAAGVKSDACRRCSLRVETLVNPRRNEWEPVDDASDWAAQDALYAYKNANEETPELIRQHVWNYDVLGECIQVLDENPLTGAPQFQIRNVLHAEVMAGGMMIRDIPGGSVHEGTAKFYPNGRWRRLWIPNEEWPGFATSPFEGILADTERYWALARRIRREAESALTGNGILWSPSEGHQPLPADEAATSPYATNIDKALYQTAERALADDDGPEAVARLSLRWGHEFGPPQTVDLSSPQSAEGIPLRQEALEAIGRGLDYPQRLFVSGAGEGNHWSDWLLDEQFAKQACSPMMERVCWQDITVSFYRPALRALQAKGLFKGNPEKYRVGFDITPIVVHPDSSHLAVDLYKLGVLSDKVLLDTTGFTEGDMANTAELGRWIMRTKSMQTKETVRAQGTAPTVQSELQSAQQVQEIPQTMQQTPAIAASVLDVPSRVLVGPLPAERVGWLDD